MSVPVIYTKHVPFRWRGIALRWVILIRPEYKDDLGLHEHEKIHIQQMKDVGTLKYFWKYFIKKDYDFIAEVEYNAFKWGSAKHDDKYTDQYIYKLLVNNYRVPHEAAKEVTE